MQMRARGEKDHGTRRGGVEAETGVAGRESKHLEIEKRERREKKKWQRSRT